MLNFLLRPVWIVLRDYHWRRFRKAPAGSAEEVRQVCLYVRYARRAGNY